MGLDVGWAVRWLTLSAQAMAEHRVELIELDRPIGDSDHGENMDRGFQAVLAKLSEAPPETPGAALKLTAMTLMSKVGGAAGPLYGTAFLRAATALGDTSDVDAATLAAALQAARDGIVVRGKAESGDKTMVDAWTPAIEAAAAAAARRRRPEGAAGRGGGRRSRRRVHGPDARPQGPRQLPGGAQHRPPRPRRGLQRTDPARRGRSGRMTVRLVVVSHSAKIADGAAELAAQMAPDVLILPAGGTDDGRIGTSLEKVMAALEQAEGDGVVVLTDLGSAVMTAESAAEFAADPGSVVLADAPAGGRAGGSRGGCPGGSRCGGGEGRGRGRLPAAGPSRGGRA